MNQPMIITERLTKNYGDFLAVHDVSLTVKQGEIYGFLGLNGAGKTTTIRMLLGMIRPTSGATFIKGNKVSAGNPTLWNNVGYMVETPYSYPDLTVKENLEIIRKLRKVSDPAAVERMIVKLQLGEYRNVKAKYLSLGNAQRLGIAKALLHQPEILILDEPSNGLDPAGIVEIRELLHDLAANRGVTIFISSHILGEISKLASRIGIIHSGQMIQEVDTAQLDRLRRRRLLLDSRDRSSAGFVLERSGFSFSVTETGLLESCEDKAVQHPDFVASLLVRSGCPPTLVLVDEEDLESYFLRTIGI